MLRRDFQMNFKAVAFGALFAGGVVCSFLYGGIRANAAVPKTLAEEADTLGAVPGAVPVEESIEDYVKGLKMLTEKEKKQLIASEKAKEPYYDRLNELMDKIHYKTNKIVEEADPIFDRIWDIKGKHEKLWDKLDSGENAKQKTVGNDMVKYIQFSDKLTAKEKRLLTDDQKKIDELYKEIDKYYAKAEKANADLNKELKEVSAKIKRIDDADAAIWEKIYER